MKEFLYEKFFPDLATARTAEELDTMVENPNVASRQNLFILREQWENKKTFTLHISISVWVDFVNEKLLGIIRLSSPVLVTEGSSNFMSIDPDASPEICLNLTEDEFVGLFDDLKPKVDEVLLFYANQLYVGVGGKFDPSQLRLQQTKYVTFTYDIGGRLYAQPPRPLHRTFLVPNKH